MSFILHGFGRFVNIQNLLENDGGDIIEVIVTNDLCFLRSTCGNVYKRNKAIVKYLCI